MKLNLINFLCNVVLEVNRIEYNRIRYPSEKRHMILGKIKQIKNNKAPSLKALLKITKRNLYQALKKAERTIMS